MATILVACGGETPPRANDGAASGIDPAGSATDSGPAGSTSGTEMVKLDLGDDNGAASDSAGDCPGGGGSGGDTAFSYIWVANSPEGTVSKIDTESGVELARYYAGPTNGDDDPSRTSVNLVGDVAVSNRAGGITKIAALEDRCVDTNGNGSIETSHGPGDVLPFGHDECVLWHVPIASPQDPENAQGPRPTAWDAGTNVGGCAADDARIWSGWWSWDQGTAYFRRYDGKTGAVLDEVDVPGYQPGNDFGYGPYGGAVDRDGNFWVTGLMGPLLRIDGVTLDVDIWEMPEDSFAYGMGVDADGHVWSVGFEGGFITHFDPDTETFDLYPTPNEVLRGMMIDRDGQLWAAGNEPCGLVQFDVASRSVVNGSVPLPGCDTPVGVSIDVDGFVWAVDQGADLAYKLDPSSYASTTTPGLVQPYTYSDMTGAGLDLVVNPPAG